MTVESDNNRDESSIFEDIGALYVRNSKFTLLELCGILSQSLKDKWTVISDLVVQNTQHRVSSQLSRWTIPSNILSDDDDTDLCKAQSDVYIYEYQDRTSKLVVGACSTRIIDDIDTLEGWFILHILSNSRLSQICTHSTTTPSKLKTIDSTTNKITDIFNSILRFTPKYDQWHEFGEDEFKQTVRKFVAQGLPVEFVLPAFPCKSSSLAKVNGTLPDLGEEMAMRNLSDFCEAVRKVHPPGAKMLIVSDGHVFSDCIGVDDTTVDIYNDTLKRTTDLILSQPSPISFYSLTDLFDLHNPNTLPPKANDFKVTHIISTTLSGEAELSRKLLMATCSGSSATLKKRIKDERSELSLYRGFSRFMLDDLDCHESFQGVSKAKRKKLSGKIAFEMVMRNKAYSNLVELLFPAHVRLSIHAHNNTGPKFGIHLMPHHIETTSTLSNPSHNHLSQKQESQEADKYLHIPTPWHNTITVIRNGVHFQYIVSKSHIIRTSLHQQLMTPTTAVADYNQHITTTTYEKSCCEKSCSGESCGGGRSYRGGWIQRRDGTGGFWLLSTGQEVAVAFSVNVVLENIVMAVEG